MISCQAVVSVVASLSFDFGLDGIRVLFVYLVSALAYRVDSSALHGCILHCGINIQIKVFKLTHLMNRRRKIFDMYSEYMLILLVLVAI